MLLPQVLKQKKLYEGQREQLYNQQFNLEQTKFTVDNIKDTVTTVQAGTTAAARSAAHTGYVLH